MVALQNGVCLQLRCRRARLRLCNRNRHGRFSPADTRDVFLLLLLSPVASYRPDRAEVRAKNDTGGQRIDPPYLLHDHDGVYRSAAPSLILLRECHPKQSHVAHLLEDLLGIIASVFICERDFPQFLFRKSAHRLAQHLLLFIQLKIHYCLLLAPFRFLETVSPITITLRVPNYITYPPCLSR